MAKESASLTLNNQEREFDVDPQEFISLVDLYIGRTFAEEIDKIGKKGVDRYQKGLKTDLSVGLSNNEDFSARIRELGTNKKEDPELPTFWDICWETLTDKINIILLILGIASLIIGATGEHPEYGWVEGFAILVVVAIIVFVSGTVGYSKIKKFKELQETHKNRARITVKRSDKPVSLHPSEILVGDLVFLDTGDVIPADGIVLKSYSLLINEAAITGENDLMPKENHSDCRRLKRKFEKASKKNDLLNPEKHSLPSPIVISGTTVAQGTAWILIIAVGLNSKEGRISELAEQEEENTPLEVKLDDVTEKVSLVGLGAGIVALVALYIRFFIQVGEDKVHGSGDDIARECISYFLLAFTVVAVAIPEGLPMAVTICLAYSVKKMQKDNNLVKKLAACETMGGADQICSDKTGTLTQNKMILKRLACFTSKSEIHSHDQENLEKLFSRCPGFLEQLKEGVCLCTSARIEEKNGEEVDVGAQTELAIIKCLRNLSSDKEEYLAIRKSFELNIVKVNPFSSERKKSSIIIQREEGRRAYVIGAPEFILKHCEKGLDLELNSHKFEKVQEEEFLRIQADMANFGLRTLALAYRNIHDSDEEIIDAVDLHKHPLVESEKLSIIALFGIYDPPRKEVPEAVKLCAAAGIKVRMVTGDNPATAFAISREVGITYSSERVIEGAKFNYLVGGVMCDKCKDKLDIPDPESKKHIETYNGDKIVCKCPRRGNDSRNDVIVDFEKFKEIIQDIDVVARCAPEHKYTIVTGLKQMGHVVAVTGDGTNDAPALRKASVGFAMGIAGTEYARHAADIILVDDNFGSIIKAVIWGRGIYDNIQRFIQFQLTVNVVAVISCIVGAITIQQSALTAVQMLWVNMIMDSLASLALATEEPTRQVLYRAPQKADVFIVTPLMFKHIFGQSFAMITLIFLYMFMGDRFLPEYDDGDHMQNHDYPGFVVSGRMYHYNGDDDYKSYYNHYGPSRHFTYIFNIFIWFQLFNEINSRRINDEIFPFVGMAKAKLFIGVWFITAGIQVLIVQVGSYAFKVSKKGLSVEQWFICIAWGTVPLFWRFVLLIIPGFKDKKIKAPEISESHHATSIHGKGPKRHFSSSYKIV
jgi:Ca2+ transporting ATPase